MNNHIAQADHTKLAELPPPTSMGLTTTPANKAVWDYLQELADIEAGQFGWIREIDSRLIEGRAEYLVKMSDLRAKVDADIANRLRSDDAEGAEWILTQVLAKPAVRDPHNFTTTVSTGCGERLSFKIIGSDDPELSPGDLGRQDRYEREEKDFRRFMSFATQLPSRIRPTTLPTPTISISDVMSQKQWILWNDDGTAVMIRCSCPMIAARMHRRGKESTTHELVPRLFHTDPTDCNLADDHFRSVHGVHGNDGQPDKVLGPFALEVRTDDGSAFHDAMSGAANNHAAVFLHQQITTDWNELLAQHAKHRAQAKFLQGTRAMRKGLASLKRTVPFASVRELNLYHFSLREVRHTTWVVICTCPTCTLPHLVEDPYENARAITHFRAHGLEFVDIFEVLHYFGFKGNVHPTPPGKPRLSTAANALYTALVTGLPEDATLPELIPAKVEAIFDRRIQWDKDERPRGVQYRARRRGRGPSHHERKDVDDSDNAPELVDEYERTHPLDARDMKKLRPFTSPPPSDRIPEDAEDAEAAPTVAPPPRRRRIRLQTASSSIASREELARRSRAEEL
ncbi:hypothetical protein F5X98DRAFT_381866 [Xylaria grammica]|nr:hypothetical protein F5X98DRAFT_381866 [Xylaria grammica]